MMHQKVRKRPTDSSTMSKRFEPRTAIGKKLWTIRKRIVASGEDLLDWDGIDREVAERRGER
jgi:hypothetical protein